MPNRDPQMPDIDWSLTTWEGSRREQLRRWAQLPLEQVILALEEMEALSNKFGSWRDARSAGVGKKDD